jgi:hypothetical protein
VAIPTKQSTNFQELFPKELMCTSHKKHLDCDHDYARFGRVINTGKHNGHKCGWAARASPDIYILMVQMGRAGEKRNVAVLPAFRILG